MKIAGREGARRHTSFNRKPLSDSTVLVVEDQRSLATMQAMLYRQRWGCEVHIADSLQRTRELLATNEVYTVACCDLNLPDAPNGEVVGELIAAGIPTIAVTGAFGGELRERMIETGVLDYVLKTNLNAYSYISDLIGRLAANVSLKVLVVDDSESIRNSLTATLSRLRLTVLTAADGIEALAVVATHPDIRMVIADFNMPRMDGVQLTLDLRKQYGKDVLAILGIAGIAGGENALLPARFLKSGANDFIAKPFSFEELVCRVNQNLDMLDLIEENRNAAYRDFLTGLPNRRYFFSKAPEVLQDAQRRGESAAVAMLDIDYFKRVNDTWGHDAGDEVLLAFGRLLAESFPDQLAARFGGEEFAVFFPRQDAASVLPALQAFVKRLAATPISLEDHSLQITASIGVASAVTADVDTLVRNADARLYQAKTAGRNRVIAA